MQALRQTHHSSMAIPEHVSMQLQLSLPVCFGRCVHLLGRTPAADQLTKWQGKRQRQLPSQYHTVTSLTPSCDLGQFTLLRYPYRSALILPSLRLRIACSTLPMLHPRTRLPPCDDDERRRGAVRAQTRPRPPFARIGTKHT